MNNRKMIYLDDALEAIRKLPNAGIHWFVSAEAVFNALLKLPSAQPERKPGRWITKLENNTYECSECGNRIITNKDYLKKHKFCFCCGAKLRGEQDE